MKCFILFSFIFLYIGYNKIILMKNKDTAKNIIRKFSELNDNIIVPTNIAPNQKTSFAYIVNLFIIILYSCLKRLNPSCSKLFLIELYISCLDFFLILNSIKNEPKIKDAIPKIDTNMMLAILLSYLS